MSSDPTAFFRATVAKANAFLDRLPGVNPVDPATGRPAPPRREAARWESVVVGGGLVSAAFGASVARFFDRHDGEVAGFFAGLCLGGWLLMGLREPLPLLPLMRRCERLTLVGIGGCAIWAAVRGNVPDLFVWHAALLLLIFALLAWIVISTVGAVGIYALTGRARFWMTADVVDAGAGMDATLGVWAVGAALLALPFGGFPATPSCAAVGVYFTARAFVVDRRHLAFVESVRVGRDDWTMARSAAGPSPGDAELLRAARLRGRGWIVLPKAWASDAGPYRARTHAPDTRPVSVSTPEELRRAVRIDAGVLVLALTLAGDWWLLYG